MSFRSKIATLLQADDPVQLAADWFLSRSDRQRIDDQIISVQQHLADSLLNGSVYSWYTLSPGSAPLSAGMAFCIASDGNVTKAVSTDLANAGGPIGLAVTAVAPGAKFRGILHGVVPSVLTGLGAGAAYKVRVNTTTGLLERVATPVPSDHLLGTTDIAGNVTVRGVGGADGAEAFSTTTADFAQPASGANVSAAIAATGWMAAGATVYIPGGGYYSVISVDDAAHATLQNTGAAGNAAATTTITSGSKVTAGGSPGVAGAAGANGTGRSAVRAVQTAALPAFTYAAGVLTITAPGVLAASVFDGVTLALNDRVEINGTAAGANVAAATNGTYLVSQVGAVGVQPKFTRTTDLDASADFVGGVSYEVVDGNTFRGKRRYLANIGTITLDTTALLFDDIVSRNRLKIDTTQYPYSVRDQSVDASDAINLALYNAQQAGFGLVELPHGSAILCGKPIKVPPKPHLKGQGEYQTTLATSSQGGGYRIILGNIPEPPHGPVVDTNQEYSLNLAGANPYWFNLSHCGGLYFNGDNDFDCSLFVRFGGSVSVGGTHLVSTRGRLLVSDTTTEMHRITMQLGVVTAHLRTFAVVGGVPTYTSTSLTSNVTMLPDTAYEIRHKCDATNGHRLWVTQLGSAYGTPVSAADPHAAQSPTVVQLDHEETIVGRGANAGFAEDTFDLECPGDATHGFYLGAIRYCNSLGNNIVSGTAPTTMGLGTSPKTFFMPCEVGNAVRGAYRDAGGALIGWRANGSWMIPNAADVTDTTGGYVSDLCVAGGGATTAVAFRIRQCLQHAIRRILVFGTNMSGMFVSGPSFYGFFETLRFTSGGQFGLIQANCDFPHNGDTLLAGTYKIYHYAGVNSGFNNSGSVFVDAEGSPYVALAVPGGGLDLGNYRISDESSSGYRRSALAFNVLDGYTANITAKISCIQGVVPLIEMGSTSGYHGKAVMNGSLTSKATNPEVIHFNDANVAPIQLGARFSTILQGAPLTLSPGQILDNGPIALTDSDEVITCTQGDWRDLAAGALATVDRNKALSAAIPALKGQSITITWGVQAHALNIRNLTVGGTILYAAAAGTSGYARFIFNGTNWARKEFSAQ